MAGDFLALDIVSRHTAAGSGWHGCPLRFRISSRVAECSGSTKKRGPNQLEGWNQWVENKAVYAMKRDLLMATGCRLGGRVGFVEMSKLESIDIDTPDDFALAEQILLARQSRVS